MRTKFLLVGSLLIVVLVATACASQPTAMPDVGETTGVKPNPTALQAVPAEDFDTLWQAFESAGATVEPGEGVAQDFFTVQGQLMKVNGAFVQVYEYETAEAMRAEASQVSEDGGSIGETYKVTWIEAPHFYRAGRMIVLYVGEDQNTLDLLEGILGPQFAGR